jgi:hypothetical protein
MDIPNEHYHTVMPSTLEYVLVHDGEVINYDEAVGDPSPRGTVGSPIPATPFTTGPVIT